MPYLLKFKTRFFNYIKMLWILFRTYKNVTIIYFIYKLWMYLINFSTVSMNDVNKISIILANPLRTIRSVKPRLSRIQSCDPSDASQSGSLNRSPDVSGNVRSQTVSDDVDPFRIHFRFPDQALQKCADMFSDKDGVVGSLRIVVPLGKFAPVHGNDVVIAGSEIFWKKVTAN